MRSVLSCFPFLFVLIFSLYLHFFIFLLGFYLSPFPIFSRRFACSSPLRQASHQPCSSHSFLCVTFFLSAWPGQRQGLLRLRLRAGLLTGIRVFILLFLLRLLIIIFCRFRVCLSCGPHLPLCLPPRLWVLC